jgi:transcriptional regulator with XRE-family HTH domain
MRGIDLRLKRVAARITAKEVAREMGVGSSRISHIETRDRVPQAAAERYLAALETLTTVPPGESAA